MTDFGQWPVWLPDGHLAPADLQFRPTLNGSPLKPYVSAGVGLVTVDPSDDATLVSSAGLRFAHESFTKPAGRLGLGFEYRLPHGFGLQVEGDGWLYNWDRYGLNRKPARHQVDRGPQLPVLIST